MFWDNYRNLCEKEKKSPNKVAAELGIASGTVTGWKNGALPRKQVLDKICDYFDVAPGYLLGDTSQQPVDPGKDPAILELSQIAELLSKTDYGITRLNFLLEEARRMQENVKKLAELESQHSQPKSTAETL